MKVIIISCTCYVRLRLYGKGGKGGYESGSSFDMPHAAYFAENCEWEIKLRHVKENVVTG